MTGSDKVQLFFVPGPWFYFQFASIDPVQLI